MGNNDARTGSAVGIDYSQERIHSGKSYIATFKTPDASPLADNATIDFLIINGPVGIDFIFTSSGTGDIEVQFYEGTAVTGNGTSVPVVGLNRERSLAQTPAVFRAPTISNDGSLLYNDIRTFGVEPQFTHNAEWVLRPNTNYLVRAINRQGAAQPVYLLVAWDEPFG